MSARDPRGSCCKISITLKTLGGTTADHYVRETPEDTKHGMAMLERELSGLETTDSEWNLLKAGD